MNHFYRKPIYLLITLFVYSFVVSHGKANGFSGDTLKRNDFRFSVNDTAALADVRQAEEDSFSVDQFNKFRGISTFRGGPYRDRASIGCIAKRPVGLAIKWSFQTQPKGEWGGGSGWTGQPGIVHWPDSVRTNMNIDTAFRDDHDFSEVIVGSLDGNIYFIDLKTGKRSRPPIDIGNPIKGSVSIDPRGYPLLYCGQGIELKNVIGFRIFSLTNQKLLYFINGHDSFAPRFWFAFDGAALINPKNDRMYLGGENGLLYSLKLNTTIDSLTRSVSIRPRVLKYRYAASGEHKQGIENSVAAWRNKLFFADNQGYIQCVDLNKFKPDWILHNHDDTDASLVIGPENNVPFLYTGCEVDKQGLTGSAWLKKINGITGEIVWERKYPCYTQLGDHPVNGGMLSTPVMGKMKGSDRVIFSLSRFGTMNAGLLIALNKKTGLTLYEVKLDNYTWSSPVDIYDTEGNLYLFLADSKGNVMLFDGMDGTLIYKEKIAELFEASPAVVDNKIIIPSRPGKIFCLEIL